MSLTTFRSATAQLVKRFRASAPDYVSSGYDEQSLRLEYLNSFFEALGWDVRNAAGAPPHLKDVRVENPTSSGEGTGRKRADYVFRIGGMDRLVCEAKKFPEDLERHHFQIQNYVFNLRLWVGVLTNFERLEVFVVGGKPDKQNPFAPVAGWTIHYSEYEKRSEDIWNLLSRSAVEGGSLEHFIQNLPKVTTRRVRQGWLIKPERTRQVDYEFLNYLDDQRKRLAKVLVHDNPDINWGESGVNEAVQKIIDRILFQQVCEDRDIDTERGLSSLLKEWEGAGQRKGALWPALVANFHRMAVTFNGGLYGEAHGPRHFVDDLVVRDEWVADFVEELSGEDSGYQFHTLPVEILGSVYERFLGSVALPNGQVVLKPEVRRAGGVFYTPEHIVNFIVGQTVGKTLVGKSPKQVQRLRVIDPACGSGSFLLRAFARICEHYVEWFIQNPTKRTAKDAYIDDNGDIKLTTDLKRQILLNNIFGVDIDPQAVEVTQLSLYLKILEDETRTTLGRQRQLFPRDALLPDLSRNIKLGNSLIGTDAVAILSGETDFDHIRPFDWNTEFAEVFEQGGFDCVIGNPPYDVLEKDRRKTSWPHEALQEYVRLKKIEFAGALGGKLNLFRFFIVKGFNLLRSDGHFGMIVPMALLADVSCAGTRLHFLGNSTDVDLRCFPQKDNKNRRIFYEAKLSTCVVTAMKGAAKGRSTDVTVSVYPWNSFEDRPRKAVLKRNDISQIDVKNYPIPLVDQREWDLCRKIHASPKTVRLDSVPDLEVNRGEINQTIYRAFITSDRRHARMLKGVEVGPYRIRHKLSQGEQDWFDAGKYLKKYEKPGKVDKRRIATQRITGVDEQLRIVATIIEPPAYFADSTNSIYLTKEEVFSLEYVLALLNSTLFQWRFKVTSTNNNVGTNELDALPFRLIDKQNPRDVEAHKTLQRLVKRAVEAGERLEGAVSEGQRDRARNVLIACQREIDNVVYRLYDLTRAEIELVEERQLVGGDPGVARVKESEQPVEVEE
jgi:Alw26I/Eco31I/Esp3I family type II restriction m6 adenine DNA methyltransferase